MYNIELSDPIHFAPVSPDLPLLSNLSIEDNIALVARYRTNVRRTQVMPVVDMLMDAAGISGMKGKRVFGVDKNTVFIVKILRAVMVEDAKIVLDRPYEMLSGEKSFEMITEIFASIENMYNSCVVLDYEWHRKFYRIDK
jgi:ABC-type lipoprotein export system ATPase subunit